MRKFLVLSLVLIALTSLAQRNNTFYVDQFQGATLADKVAAAQKSCLPDSSARCTIVFDPTLSSIATGTLPSRCAQCQWIDSPHENSLQTTSVAWSGTSKVLARSIKEFAPIVGTGGWYGGVACTENSALIDGIGVAESGRAAQAGDTIVVSGCGNSGSDLQCVLNSVANGIGRCGNGVVAHASLRNRGARWGNSVDDTPAFAAAIAWCVSVGGCTIDLPSDTYFVSNIIFPTGSKSVKLRGAGRNATWVIGIGSDKTPVFQAPTNSAPSAIESIGFRSWDYHRTEQIAVQWLGGQEHAFIDNYVSGMWEMVNASNTWINIIERNRCYVVNSHCIEFGTGRGNDTVNATRVVFNELSNWGYPAGDTTKHAYYVHSGSASYENTFAFNSIEHSNPPMGEPIDANDNLSQFYFEYAEVSGAPSSFFGIFRGTGQVLHFHGVACISIPGAAVTVFAQGSSGSCPAHSYSVDNSGSGLSVYGLSFKSLKNTGNNVTAYGLDMWTAGGGLKAVFPSIGSSDAYPTGAVYIGDFPLTNSTSTGSNPTSPNQFGASALIPNGTVVFNRYMNYAPTQPLDSNVFWVCDNGGSSCSNNPIVPSQWKRFGEKHSKVHAEATAAPTTGTWRQGDWFFNIAATERGSDGGKYIVFGWYCVAGGTPGTWVPMRMATGN